MRVLHAVISGDMAGGQLVCRDILEDRASRGDDVALLSPGEGLFTERCRATMPVHILPFSTLHDLSHVPEIIWWLRRFKADLVHTHVMVPGNIIWRLACAATRTALIQHVHSANFFGPSGVKASIVQHIDTTTSSLSRVYIAVSAHTAGRLLNQGYPRDLVRVVYNGVEEQSPTAGPAAAGPVIICVGRLCDSKGQQQLVEAFAEVAPRFPLASLWLVGKDQQTGGRFERRLRATVRWLQLEAKVVFWGHREDARELMARASVLVLPSATEAFPLVLLEAMGQGVPVVATAVGGVPEIIRHSETGLLVPPGDVKALGAAISGLLSDEALRSRLGESGRQCVRQQFSKASMLSGISAIYDEVLGESN